MIVFWNGMYYEVLYKYIWLDIIFIANTLRKKSFLVLVILSN